MNNSRSLLFVVNLVTCLLVSLSVEMTAAQGLGRPKQVLPDSDLLELDQPLDEVMVAGINRFALRKLNQSAETRVSNWNRDVTSDNAYFASVRPNRERFRKIIGAVDERVPGTGLEMIVSQRDFPSKLPILARSSECVVREVRWPVFEGVTGEGLLLAPIGREPTASVIAIPDANCSPEAFVGLIQDADTSPIALQLASQGCEVLVPTLISLSDTFSGNEEVAYTNQPHREFVYRTSFEVGRHVIGFEVQKVLAAVDHFSAMHSKSSVVRPIGLVGVGEGGLLAFYSAAIDKRITSVMVSGYFDEREQIWREPIYRNVWSLLTEFADSDIASLIAPRKLTIEACQVREVVFPLVVQPGRRGGGAPGVIRTPDVRTVRAEFDLAKSHFQALGVPTQIQLIISDLGTGTAGSDEAIRSFLLGLGPEAVLAPHSKLVQLRPSSDPDTRQKRQVDELIELSQRIVRESHRIRQRHWKDADATTITSWIETSASHRDEFYSEVIGRLPPPTVPLNPRTRLILEEPGFHGYEVMLDVYPDVIAGGILLLPNDLQPDEKRPVVVCQHGLEGTAAGTLESRDDGFLPRGFAAELALRGFIVYAPQNPYRGGDAFRSIQRKSNPLKRSLFSYIIRQHERTLQWLSSLANVDASRIAFYGISYGGKTAVRVPPFVPQYALSICSADFNEWIGKTTSNVYPASYVFTGEYEIWEWNMGHVASYGELASLMSPRPFMVERGHDDGVAPDEWVASEYAKVRRHYDQLGIGNLTQIEFFNGPHTIHGVGTFKFLHQHLDWPESFVGKKRE